MTTKAQRKASKNPYNTAAINDNPPVEEKSKSIKRLEDEAASHAAGKRRRRIEELADKQAERREQGDWNYV